MANNQAHKNDGHPLHELSPGLRRGVEAVVQKPVPEQVMLRALQAARRQRPTDADSQPRLANRRWLRLALPCGLSAAAIVVAMLSRVAPLSDSTVPGPAVPPSEQTTIAPSPPSLPTAWACHRALSQSPEAFFTMLDLQAQHTLRPEPQSIQASVRPHFPQPTL
jgi:hypothetical protein